MLNDVSSETRQCAVKVLVVEDETIVGMDLVMLLEEWGYAAKGPLKNVPKALKLLESFAPDVAILDVNLGEGTTSAPIAERLAEMKVPFLFLTGYDETRYVSGGTHIDAPHLRKPLDDHELRNALADLAPQPWAGDRPA